MNLDWLATVLILLVSSIDTAPDWAVLFDISWIGLSHVDALPLILIDHVFALINILRSVLVVNIVQVWWEVLLLVHDLLFLICLYKLIKGQY